MKSLFLLPFLFLCTFSFGQTHPDTSSLQAMLDLDRFEAYTEAWAATMRGRGKEQIAEIIHALGPADFRAMDLNAEKLKDAKNYDALILQVLKKKSPSLRVTAADVDWGYNFFKNKLNEAYLVKDVKPAKPTDPAPVPGERRRQNPLEMNPLASEEVLLDVDAYASDRTTRAVFWEASDTGRQIELFPGSASSFQDELTRRGARIIAEVGTKARNYNPIYLIQNPGERGYHYAITEISGADRLRHFQLQVSLVRWKKANGRLAPPAPVKVVGDAAAILAEEERALAAVLRTAPRADHVVIGQKGAFERTFGSLGKIQSILSLNATDPQGVKRALTPNEIKIISRAQEAGANLPQFVMKYASDIDKLYQKADPLLTKHNLQMRPFTTFNYDRGSYEMSDYLVRGTDGKEQRWRIFSNVWGDEVLPIARSLKTNGYNSVNYIGTAGAFPDNNLRVGDLVIPRQAATIDGELSQIPRNTTVNPEGAKRVDAVVNVQSPFEETGDWLARARRTSQVVEVETGYLASVFNSPTDNLNVQLLISDVVGSEDETLATASSSSRRKAQISAISSVIQDAGVVSTAAVADDAEPLMRMIQEIVPNRDPASMVQIAREADAKGIRTRAGLEEFIGTQKSFTTAKLETMLRGADLRLGRFLSALRTAGIDPLVSFSKRLFDARFNPSSEVVKVHITANAQDVPRVNQIILDAAGTDSVFKKHLDLTVSSERMTNEYQLMGRASDPLPTTKNIYQDGILHYGGLGTTENSSGRLKFVRVGGVNYTPLDRPALGQISSGAKCAIANFGAALDELLD